uniref:Uncharacterized protein n=1 Tax=Rhizophagus irregularis (strain DAOM 181602 / DAOM 197198 / MUCL 43194) TaxID=747089 RepID=U9TRF6_RHIID
MELVGYCGECGKNMIKEYKSWMDKFAVPDVILNKVFGTMYYNKNNEYFIGLMNYT